MTDWAEYWRIYRKRTGELTWRLATPDDIPAIRRLRNATERLLHTPQGANSVFSLPVLLALVAEDDNGKVVDVIQVEAQLEIIKQSCNSVGFHEAAGLKDDLAAWARALGFKTARITLQTRFRETMKAVLYAAGFRCEDGDRSFWKIRI